MSITKPLRIHRKQMSNRTEDLFNEVYDTDMSLAGSTYPA